MRKAPLSSSTGTRFLIAATGLSLYAYLVIHLAGNLLVFAGPETFNRYSHTLVRSPLIYPLEIALASLFFLHIYRAVTNYLANRRARPVGYRRMEWVGKPSRRTAASWTMILTGLFTVLFVLVHLQGIKFGPHYEVHGEPVRDLYRTQMEHLGNPLVALFYLVSLVFLGMHVWHGFWSAFQSFGLGSARYTPKLVAASQGLAVVLMAGFALVVLWVFFVAAPAYLSGARP